jgi:hypothetical protein
VSRIWREVRVSGVWGERRVYGAHGTTGNPTASPGNYTAGQHLLSLRRPAQGPPRPGSRDRRTWRRQGRRHAHPLHRRGNKMICEMTILPSDRRRNHVRYHRVSILPISYTHDAKRIPSLTSRTR